MVGESGVAIGGMVLEMPCPLRLTFSCCARNGTLCSIVFVIRQGGAAAGHGAGAQLQECLAVAAPMLLTVPSCRACGIVSAC